MYEQIIFTYIYLLVHFLNLYVYKLSSNIEPLISLIARSKGQEISEWKYKVVALPKIWTKNFEKSCPK